MIQELRDDTPGCKQRIHLNNAGASLPPQPVLQAMQQYLELESTIGGYEAVDLLHDELQGFYDAVANMLGTQANNIAYAGSATDAYAKVLSSIPWQKGDVIVTSENDYSSNRIAFLALKKRFGVEIIPSLSVAISDAELADLESLIKNQPPKLLAISHIPTNNGLVQPVEAIGKILRNTETLYLVDACQSAGQMRLDVNTIGCDFLTATMRKFMRGPRGAGFLYASDRVFELGLEMMLPDMRSATWTSIDGYKTVQGAKGYEYWEVPYELVMGSKVATEYAVNLGLEWIEAQVKRLADLSRNLLSEMPGVEVLDLGNQQCGIVTAHADHWDYGSILQKLQAEHINCRVSPGMVQGGEFPAPGRDKALRVSPHYYNTEDEIRRFAEVLRREFPR